LRFKIVHDLSCHPIFPELRSGDQCGTDWVKSAYTVGQGLEPRENGASDAKASAKATDEYVMIDGIRDESWRCLGELSFLRNFQPFFVLTSSAPTGID